MAAKIAVLGGLGLMAEAALHDLARSSEVAEVVAADLHIARKDAVLAKLPAAVRRKVKVVSVDLTDTAKAAKALRGTRVLINAAWYEFNLKAMDLAEALGAHYLDLGGLYHMTLRQLPRAAAWRKRGLLGVLGCGSTPGITNMMVQRMAPAFDSIETVAIYDASHDPSMSEESFLPPFSIRTMLDEYEMPAPILENGKMIAAPPHSRPSELEFKAPIGKCVAGTVIHSETATLPAYLKGKGIKNLCFKIVYPPSVKAQLALIVGMGLSKDAPVRVNGASVSPRRLVTNLALQSAAKAGESTVEPADFEVLRILIQGKSGGKPLSLTWDVEMSPKGPLSAGAIGVGWTASIVAQQILRGALLRESGVCGPEDCLDGKDFFRELTARGTFRVIERVERPLAVIG